ncbi:hypothetical protein ZIOFF_030691 [Zingiber officinale]|uniref:Uncharacterized protein n=1 Tax=Zingiber officinale TaxID=94328 RepID=A0A8J5GYI6_ZINOF|nr:hypothetical protein ZIOFF_030691 [Zingiber officinale]
MEKSLPEASSYAFLKDPIIGPAILLLFAAASIIAWLMHTREILRSLSYNVGTTPYVNVLEKCCRQNLEALDLNHKAIIRVAPSYQRFTCLKSLSLRHVSISSLNPSLFLAVCPRIESLTLDAIEILTSEFSEGGNPFLLRQSNFDGQSEVAMVKEEDG